MVPRQQELSSEDATSNVSSVGVLPKAPWAFIAVMGVTGAGKSTFIRTASGDESVVVGDGLKSCTCSLSR